MNEISKTAYFWLGFTFDPPPPPKKKRSSQSITWNTTTQPDLPFSPVVSIYLRTQKLRFPPRWDRELSKPGVCQNSYSPTPFAYFQEFLPFLILPSRSIQPHFPLQLLSQNFPWVIAFFVLFLFVFCWLNIQVQQYTRESFLLCISLITFYNNNNDDDNNNDNNNIQAHSSNNINKNSKNNHLNNNNKQNTPKTTTTKTTTKQ